MDFQCLSGFLYFASLLLWFYFLPAQPWNLSVSLFLGILRFDVCVSVGGLVSGLRFLVVIRQNFC